MSLAAMTSGSRSGASALVLVVNDEPALGRRIVHALAAAGLRAVWVSELSDADAALGVEAPDLVIVDELLGPSTIDMAPAALRSKPRIVVRFDAADSHPSATVVGGADWFERLPALALEVLGALAP